MPSELNPAKSLRGQTILVVDDDAVCGMVINHVLTRAGYAVTTLQDGRAAIEFLENHEVGLVLMDWHLPQLDGMATTAIIRGSVTGQIGGSTKLIAMSTPEGIVDRDPNRYAGADGFVSKPINPDALLSTVAGMLNPSAGGSAEPSQTRSNSTDGVPGTCAEAQTRLPPSLAERMTERFFELLPGEIRTLELVLDQADVAGLQSFGHRIRGSADVIGAIQLSARATEVELACKQGDQARAIIFAGELLRTLQALAGLDPDA